MSNSHGTTTKRPGLETLLADEHGEHGPDKAQSWLNQENPQEKARRAAVADARYLMRRAFRIIDEEARNVGLEPLEHQLIVQLRGAPDRSSRVTELAARLDVPLGLVSRLVRKLEQRQLVVRNRSPNDKRATLVSVTAAADELARTVSERIRPRYKILQNELSYERRLSSIMIWARIFGVLGNED